MFKRKNKLKILIIFLFVLFSLSMGYAYLTKRLSISGNTSVTKASWIIYFDNVEKTGGTIEADVEPIIDDTKTITTYSLSLNKPGDYYEYTIDTVNDGTVDAMIESVSLEGLSEENKKYVTFEAKYINGQDLKQCDLLSAGTREKIKVTIKYNNISNKEDLPSDIDLELVHKINYVQSDTCATAIKHNVIIDPNGGTYKGTSDKFVSNTMNEGETLEIEEPVREGFIFSGWSVSEPDVLSNNVVTMGKNTITLTANWTVEGGIVARINSTYYGTVQSAIDAAIPNDVIYLLKDTVESPINDKNVTLNLQGHTITGTFTNASNLTLISTLDNTTEAKESGVGKIESMDSTAFINNGTLTLGVNDDEILVDNVAIIASASQVGLEQKGTFNFYDGYLEGKIGLAGSYHDTPLYRTDDQGTQKFYYPFVDHNIEKNCQKVYLAAVDRAVAKEITENNKEIYYYNLQDAINTSVVTGYNIYAIRDFEAAYSLNVNENESTLFDLCGFKVSTGYTITNNGTFTIVDSATTKGSLNNSEVITNNGTLKIKDATIAQTTSANVIDQNGVLELENSTITALDGYAINNSASGILSLDETTYLKSNTYAIYNFSEEQFTVEGGNIVGIYNASTIKIQNSHNITMNYPNYAIKNTKNMIIDNITVSGIINSTGTNSNKGTIDINELTSNSGLEILQSNYSIKNSELKSSTIINGSTGKIELSKISCYSWGIELLNGTLDLIDVDIDQRSESNYNSGSYAVYTRGSSSILNIISGNIFTQPGKYPAIYATAGIVNVGTLDETVSQEKPLILGGTYGIQYQAGTVINFYDGTIGGITAPINGGYTSVPEDYTIIESTLTQDSQTYNTNYLDKQKDFIEVNGKTFNDIVEAYESIEENEGTMKLIADASIVDSIQISEDQNITLDLNGFVLNTTGNITNKGVLKITDTAEDGKIISAGNSHFINNTNTFILENAAIENVINKVYAVYSNAAGANVTIKNSEISGQRGIYTYGSRNTYATVDITDSTFDIESSPASDLYAIYSQYSNTNIKNCNITINSLNRGYDAYGVYQGSYGQLNMDNTDIKGTAVKYSASYTYADAVTNVYTATSTTITNSNLTSTGYGVYSKGNTTIENTDISADYMGIESDKLLSYNSGTIKNGVYGILTRNTLNIGNIENAVDFSSPSITGSIYAIYNGTDSEVNYNDGILKGGKTVTYTDIKSFPDGHVITEGTEVINEVTYYTYSLTVQENIVAVDGIEYNSLQKAIDSIETEGSMYLLNNANIGAEIKIPEEKKITLDLKGYKLFTTNSIINDGEFTIDDTVGDGGIHQVGSVNLIVNNNNFIMNKGHLSSSDGNYAIYSNADSVKTTINSGRITGSNGIYSKGVSNNDKTTANYASLTINNLTMDLIVTYTAEEIYAVYNDLSNATVNNSEIILGQYSINYNILAYGLYQTGTGTMTIDNLTLDSSENKVSTIFIYSKGKLNIENVTSSPNATGSLLHLYGGTATIKNANVNNAIYMSAGTLNVYDGTYKASTSYTLSVSGTANIYGGTFQNDDGYGILVSSGGTLNIGSNDGTLSRSPIIQGSTYGIYSYTSDYRPSVVNFYDGTIKGVTDTFKGPCTSTAPGAEQYFEKITENDIEYSVTYLVEPYVLVKNGDKEYTNIQTAIATANNGDILTFVDNASILYALQIPEELEITMDFNGYFLKTASTITNDGNLTITNTNPDSESYIRLEKATTNITNNNILNVNNVSLKSNYSKYIVENTEEATATITNNTIEALAGINNNGNLIISNMKSVMISENGNLYSLSNTSGNLTIENSDINLGVYNSNAGTIISNNNIINATITTAGKIDINGGEYTAYNVITSTATDEININNAKIAGSIVTKNSASTMTLDNCTIIGTINNASNMIVKSSNLEVDTTSNNITNSGTMLIDSSNYKIAEGVSLKNTGTLDVNNSLIYGETDPSNYGNGTALYNDKTGVINLNNSTIDMKKYRRGYGIYNTSSAVTNIKNSSILMDSSSLLGGSTSDYLYGIYINNGTIVMGQKDETENSGTQNADVSTEMPLVKSVAPFSAIGVKKVNGYFMYYDGKIIGSTNAKPDTTTEVEYNYEATTHIDETTGYEYVILEYLK